VVPAVAGLKKQGANNGACLSFLISAPETGVDSIALSYSLLDPVMTVTRPVVAFVTALTAGLVENLTESSDLKTTQDRPGEAHHISGHRGSRDSTEDSEKHRSFVVKLSEGMSFAANELMNDFAGWLLLGILLAAVITVMVPESLFHGSLGTGITAYLAVLLGSLPLYVCASMSTPIAAALVLKGMSPGAALVLLMAGPATNMATITMVGGILGKRTLAIYLSSIVGCTLVFAFATDMLYQLLGISAKATVGSAGYERIPEWLQLASALVLAGLIIRVLFHKGKYYWIREPEAGPERSREACCHEECGCAPNDTGKT